LRQQFEQLLLDANNLWQSDRAASAALLLSSDGTMRPQGSNASKRSWREWIREWRANRLIAKARRLMDRASRLAPWRTGEAAKRIRSVRDDDWMGA
jgi:hypothetical protein